MGTGFGLRVHVPALRSCGVDVVGLVGQDRERTRRRAERVGIAGAFSSLTAALDECDTDIVTIASPPGSHRSMALEALGYGKHVICEKPLAVDAIEAAEMCEAAARAGRVAYVGYEFRYSPANALVNQLIQSGAIGDPRVVTVVRMYSLLARPDAPAPAWWFRPESGGGWLNGNGSHAVDMMLTQLGEIRSVSALLFAVHPREGGGDDSFAATFVTTSGARGVFQESAAVWGPPLNVWQVAGTKGTVAIDDDVVHVADESGDRPVHLPPELELEMDFDLDDTNNRPWTRQEIAPYRRLVTDFCREVRGESLDAAGPQAPTFEDGRKAVQVLDAIRRSAVLGGAAVLCGPNAATEAEKR
ncbi:MAG TPA: Gfo/Idh/MocA family oxidoreductase [Acidimicrobiales bacterium]|nr:Gfo/Idh/MocA family oxidoreductase [Acidimicrobiales bacterium]